MGTCGAALDNLIEMEIKYPINISKKNSTQKNQEIKKEINQEIKNVKKDEIKIETKNEIKKEIIKSAINEIKEEPFHKVIKNENIIRECQIKDSSPIIPEEITDVLKQSTARIEIDEKKAIFTGFFMIINIKGKQHNFILTCYHSIPQEDIDSKKKIIIHYGKTKNEEKLEIILDDKKRYIKTYEVFDVTLIEILKEDKIKKKRYLYPDLNYKNTGFFCYKDSKVYTAGYPNVEVYKEGRHISSGLIKAIDESESSFEHTCDTRKGSSGSPIINYAKLVVGIHYGSDSEKTKNYGYFIGAIIDKLNNEGKENIKNTLNEKEEEPKKKDNFFINEIKNEIKNGTDKAAIEILGTCFSNPDYIQFAGKMLSNPKCTNMFNQLSIFKNPKFNNMFNDMKEFFTSDDLDINGFTKEINDLKNERINKLENDGNIENKI